MRYSERFSGFLPEFHGKYENIISIEANFGFDTKKINPTSRLYNKDFGGGAILDVGCYPLAIINLVNNLIDKNNEIIFSKVDGNICETGVDDYASAELKIAEKIKCNITVAIKKQLINNVTIKTKNGKVVGVKTSLGIKIFSKTVILTNGTFLNGKIHIGEKNFQGGRAGENSSVGLTSSLLNLGFVSGRMKTGTPPRVDGRSLDYNKMKEQPGDTNPSKFSFSDETKPLDYEIAVHSAKEQGKFQYFVKRDWERELGEKYTDTQVDISQTVSDWYAGIKYIDKQSNFISFSL